jgi:hypothetical protein
MQAPRGAGKRVSVLKFMSIWWEQARGCRPWQRVSHSLVGALEVCDKAVSVVCVNATS